MHASTVTTREPAVIIGTITAAVASVLVLLAAFGIDLTPEQQVAIIGVIAGVGPLVAALLTRRVVTSSAAVVQVVTPDGTVVAGPASPLANGTPIVVVPTLAP